MTGHGTNRFEYEESTTCCICDRRQSDSCSRIEKQYPWGTARFVRCASCGSWHQSPQITLESLRTWFDSPDYQGSESRSGIAYINYLEDESSRLAEAQSRYRHDLMRDLRKGSKVLELGCSTGSLLSVMRDQGCDVVGIDLSPKFVEAAKRLHGIDVLLGDLNDFDLPANSFDLIVLFGTIGNLKDPSSYFRRFRQLLKSTGFLIFNFVDADSPVVKYVYRTKFWMFTPSVSCFMTRRGCELALKENGFKIISIRNDRQRPSFQKFFNHARMSFLMPALKRLGMNTMSLAFSLPIPSIRFVKAMPDAGFFPDKAII